MSIEDHIRQSGQPPRERIRQHRERQAQGIMIARAPVDSVIYNELVRYGLLKSEYESDASIVGQALVRFVRMKCHLSTST